MSIFYVCVPTVNCYDFDTKTINVQFLKDLAFLQERYADDLFVSVSLMGYSIVPYMQESKTNGYNDWRTKCESMMKVSDKFVVLMYPKYRESYGVCEELKYADAHDIPVEYFVPKSQWRS